MKQFTIDDLLNFPVDENGYRICPPGDYSQIKTFPDRCSFSVRCSFGKWCSFGEWCRFCEGCSHEGLTNSRYIAVDKIGSEKRKTYFFASEEGFFVRAGCWFGTFDEFEARVKDVHGGTRHEKDYLAALSLAKQLLS